MITILFIVGVWLLCKGIRAAFRPRRHVDKDPRYYSDDTKRFYDDIDNMIEKYRAENETETEIAVAAAPEITPEIAPDPKQILANEIDRQCLQEQLIFINDILESEINPDKTLKWMKEKQKVLKALAAL